MSRIRTKGRSDTRLRLARRSALVLAVLTASVAALAPAAAQADDPAVTLQSVFVSPISSTEEQCNPETAAAAEILGRVATEPETTQAGASNDLCFGFTLPDGVSITGDDIKTIAATLPVGLAGEPDAVPTCSDADFGLTNFAPSTCADSAMVGTVYTRLTTRVRFSESGLGSSNTVHKGGTAAPHWDSGNERWDGLTDGGYVYNLTHDANELARLGVVIQPVTGLGADKFTVSMRLAADGSGRIETVVDNAPREAYYEGFVNSDGSLTDDALPSDVYVQSIGIRVWGSPAGRVADREDGNPTPLMGGHDFIQFGTNCTDASSAHVDLTTYAGVSSSMDSNEITPTGCDALPFEPSISLTTTAHAPATPTGLTVKVDIPQTDSGVRSATLRDASVTMPAGLELGAQVASGDSGLPLCTAAAFAEDTLAANTCPAGSKVGDVKITTPLLSRAFVGSVYLGEQSAVGELPPLYLEVAPEGADAADAPRIKLVGSVSVNDDGVLTTTFNDAPQLRFSSLELTFPDGPHALFSTPRTCDEVRSTSTFTSWSGKTATADASIQMTDSCDLPGFAPTLAMQPSNSQAGATAPTSVQISRDDRSPWLTSAKVSLPSGYLADLTVVTECGSADAQSGNCPESSRIGTVTTQSGVGDAPLSLSGSMYLVERQEGAVAGAVIVVRAKIGELDLGDVVVPARIDLRPTDAGLVLTTDVPTRFKGLALNVRSIDVNLDRENFSLNPTACGPLTATAEMTGDGGQTATPTAQVTYTGCGNLPFQPSFSAKLSGDTKALGHPQVDVTMTARAGDSNIKSATVTLPAGISTDLKNLQVTCSQDTFYAGGCGTTGKVGTVSATVSITNDTISGDVYLVKVAGVSLPGIGMSFTGRYAQRVLSTVKVDKSGRVITSFAAIPDLPLRRLQMTINGGTSGPIQVSPDVPTTDTSWDAEFTGQGGQTAKSTIVVPTSIPATSVTWNRKTGLKMTLTAPTGKRFKSAKITLPSGITLKSGSARKKYANAKLTGGKGKTKRSTHSLAVTATSATTGPTKVTFTVRVKGYNVKKQLKKGKKLKVTYRAVTSDATVVSKSLTVKVK
ncbi:MAG: hypothetical protein QM679_03010 [Patulibacter sp.]